MADGQMADTGQAAEPDRLTVVSTATDGIRVLTLAGEIDNDTSQPLRQALDASETPSPRIVVDLSRVTFMDSTGINTFIAAHHSLTEARNPPTSPQQLTGPRTAGRRAQCWW